MKMMKQQSSQYTGPSWLKWTLLLTGFVLILGFSLAIWMYVDVQKYRTSGFEETKQLVKKETEISSVTDLSVYYGDRTVHIVEGILPNGDRTLTYVDLKDRKILTELNKDDVYPLSKMKSVWEKTCEGCTFRKIQYAYEEGQPVFEITYIDKQNRYVLNYYQMDGEPFDQRFAFKQSE